MIEAVLFDLDGTLLDRARTLELFLDRQFGRFADALAPVGRKAYVRSVWEWDGHGHVPKAEVYARAQKEFGLPPTLRQALLEDFEARFHGLAIPFAGLHEMLALLSSRDLALGLVTNGMVRSQQPKIEALGIAGYFRAILISEKEGVRKPDPEIYRRALREVGSRPERAVFIGDHPEADIGGAARLGMKTVWKRNACWPAPDRADAVIDGLEEIPPLLVRWGRAATAA